MRISPKFLFVLFLFFAIGAKAQDETKKIPLEDEADFFSTLPASIPNAAQIKALYSQGKKTEAIHQLAVYFKEKSQHRFFFNWANVANRLQEYQQLYPNAAKNHLKDANSHTELYQANTPWKLPFKNEKGNDVTAYEIRHLFRQHKAGDFAFSYYLSDRSDLLPYFTGHVRSLNQAYQADAVELISAGNGAYESFRGGNRVENWVLAHHLFLGSPDYSDQDQVTMIRTLIHHAEVIFQTNQDFQFGNHQTKGMVALAVIAMMYPEFEASKTYFDFAISNLGKHLELEINPDGFQFERSFHYHVGDIDNYFRVYKLALITGTAIPESWEAKLKSMFQAMKTIALPNKAAPVIQDDTDQPMATQNQLDEVMALGYVLFPDPEFAFLAGDKPSEEYYWLLSREDLAKLKTRKEKRPTMKSAALVETGYYVFRDGWKDEDQYLLISTGVSKEKPDHQHGDVLGFQLFANGEMLIPNYQVRYPVPEFQFFKNSWVKNVALVDSIAQGQEWTGNQGGSGFGKFAKLPKAEVLLWEPKGDVQAFVGSHDGYANQEVSYMRSIYYFSGDFWLIRDHFKSKENHIYYQNFQGNYSLEDCPGIARSSQANGGGLDIIQVGTSVAEAKVAGNLGKNRVTFQSPAAQNVDFVTILRPYESSSDRTALMDKKGKLNLGDWEVFTKTFQSGDLEISAAQIFKKDKQYFLLGMTRLASKSEQMEVTTPVDVLVSISDAGFEIKSFEPASFELKSQSQTITLLPLQTHQSHAK
ncbi:hypothetical protein GCM10009119_04140 [Algoriphagus jejuensis]|uniref:Heparinase II/III-like protein n=1 Tax=Algoriphagus jejuensis TaxID=419934 RepID=A0ABP3YA80_9BACT